MTGIPMRFIYGMTTFVPSAPNVSCAVLRDVQVQSSCALGSATFFNGPINSAPLLAASFLEH